MQEESLASLAVSKLDELFVCQAKTRPDPIRTRAWSLDPCEGGGCHGADWRFGRAFWIFPKGHIFGGCCFIQRGPLSALHRRAQAILPDVVKSALYNCLGTVKRTERWLLLRFDVEVKALIPEGGCGPDQRMREGVGRSEQADLELDSKILNPSSAEVK